MDRVKKGMMMGLIHYYDIAKDGGLLLEKEVR